MHRAYPSSLPSLLSQVGSPTPHCPLTYSHRYSPRNVFRIHLSLDSSSWKTCTNTLSRVGMRTNSFNVHRESRTFWDGVNSLVFPTWYDQLPSFLSCGLPRGALLFSTVAVQFFSVVSQLLKQIYVRNYCFRIHSLIFPSRNKTSHCAEL